MNLKISFKGVKHSQAVDEKIQEKVTKLQKYLGGGNQYSWHTYKKEGKHVVDAHVVGPHYEYHASASDENLFKVFDQVCGKLERQIAKKKDKWKDKHQKQGLSSLEMNEPEVAWTDYDENEFDDVA